MSLSVSLSFLLPPFLFGTLSDGDYSSPFPFLCPPSPYTLSSSKMPSISLKSLQTTTPRSSFLLLSCSASLLLSKKRRDAEEGRSAEASRGSIHIHPSVRPGPVDWQARRQKSLFGLLNCLSHTHSLPSDSSS